MHFFIYGFPSSTGVCSVVDESHYLTFDGKTYNFTNNCTYYLVKEIVAKYNLVITINRNCSSDKNFCPQTLTVKYGSTKVIFTQKDSSENIENEVSSDSGFSFCVCCFFLF